MFVITQKVARSAVLLTGQNLAEFVCFSEPLREITLVERNGRGGRGEICAKYRRIFSDF